MREWTRMPFEWRIFAYSLLFATHSVNFLLHSGCIPKIRADSCVRPECFWHVKNCRSTIEVANIERHSNVIRAALWQHSKHSNCIRTLCYFSFCWTVRTVLRMVRNASRMHGERSLSVSDEFNQNHWRSQDDEKGGNFIKGICIHIGLHQDVESKYTCRPTLLIVTMILIIGPTIQVEK